MLTLAYTFLLTFRPAIAAPVGSQGTLANLIPDDLRPVVQKVINFLDPHHPPSLEQTVISCLSLLSVSIFMISLPSKAKARKEGLFRFRFSAAEALHGLLSPDFVGFQTLGDAMRDFFIAMAYNNILHEEGPNIWIGVHIAFLKHGGFVLQEGGKTTEVLTLARLVHMIKAGEIERPDVSYADILAKSMGSPTSMTILLFLCYLPIYWFIEKFKSKLPLVVALVALHAMLTLFILIVHSQSITGIVEPIVIVRKSRGASHQEAVPRDDISELERVVESTVTVDRADDVKVPVEETPVIPDSGMKPEGHVQPVIPFSDQTGHRSLRPSIVRLLALPLRPIRLVLDVLLELLNTVYSASKAPLVLQWKIINGPCHFGTFGECAAIIWGYCLIRTIFIVLSWQIQLNVEWKIWTVSSHFLLLQPLVLLLVRPQRIRMRLKERAREVIYVLYTFAYVVARLSIPFAALYSIRNVM